jgi:hypothetical protein
MDQAPSLSTEARVATRRVWREMALAADRVQAAIAALSRVTLANAAAKDPIVARRAAAFIKKRIPAQLVLEDGARLAWRYLCPVDDLTLVMRAVLLNAPGRGIIETEPFGATYSHHCIARYHDRAGHQADAVEEMHQAHGALLRLEPAEGDAMFALRRLMLPSSGGAFIARPTLGNADHPPLARCWTWISSDMMFEDQDGTLKLWRRLLASRAA